MPTVDDHHDGQQPPCEWDSRPQFRSSYTTVMEATTTNTSDVREGERSGRTDAPFPGFYGGLHAAPQPAMSVIATPPTGDGHVSRAAQRLIGGGDSVQQRLAPRHLDFSEDGETSTPLRSSAVKNSSTEAVVVTPTTPLVQFYAVARGRCIGVYHSHAEMLEETKDYKDAVYRVCKSPQEAERFIDRYLDLTMGRRGDPDPRHRSTLVAFCVGGVLGDRHWSHHTGVACLFPHNADWDVLFTCNDMYCTLYRASAKAALSAVQRANVEDPLQQKVLYVYTRSQLLIRAMMEWIDKWQQNGWLKGDGEPVKNKDVLRRLVKTQGRRRIIWKLEDQWTSQWTASAVSAAEAAAQNVEEVCLGVFSP